jgi:hypothetical protein
VKVAIFIENPATIMDMAGITIREDLATTDMDTGMVTDMVMDMVMDLVMDLVMADIITDAKVNLNGSLVNEKINVNH